MENQESTYLNYGNKKIEQLAFLNAVADNLPSYINSLPWSEKKKKRVLEAYANIMNSGVVGANNQTGQWAVDINLNIDLDSMPEKIKEAHHEAAHYILEQMKELPYKENESEDKKSLLLYDNKTHTDAFESYIGNNLFGGRSWDLNTDWEDTYDPRDPKTGIRTTSGRTRKLAEMLEGYKNSLEEGKYNFEGTAFKDLSDLKNRIDNAINVLKDDNFDLADKDALNQLGLDWKKYLSDGSQEEIVLPDGTKLTRGEALTLLQKEEENNKLQQEQNALIQQKALQKRNIGVLSIIEGIHGSDVYSQPDAYKNYLSKLYGEGEQAFNKINVVIQDLLERGYTSGLNSNEKKLLGNLLGYIRKYNPNYNKKSNITDQEWSELKSHNNLKSQNRAGFVRLPWQTSDGRYTFADDNGNVYFLKPRNQQKLNSVSFRNNPNYLKYKLNFLRSPQSIQLEQQNEHKLSEGLTSADYAIMGSIAADAASMAAAFAPGYGTVASAVLGLGATGALAYADIAKGESLKNTLTNAGTGVLFDALGLIPGLGSSGKFVKMAKGVGKIAKYLGPALAAYSATLWGPGAMSAFNKIITGKHDEINGEELQDFAYGMRTILAGGRSIGVTRSLNKSLNTAIAEGRAKISGKGGNKATVKTKNGEIVELSESQAATINSKTASVEAKNAALREAAPNLREDDGLVFLKRSFKHPLTKESLGKLDPKTFTKATSGKQQIVWTQKPKRFSNEAFAKFYSEPWGKFSLVNKYRKFMGLEEPISNRGSKSSVGLGGGSRNEVPKNTKFLPEPGDIHPRQVPNSTKDIRAWDNDVIPLFEAPKPGGKVGTRPKVEHLNRQNQQEINNWIDSYRLSDARRVAQAGSTLPISKGGYNKSSNVFKGSKSDVIKTNTGENIDISYTRGKFGRITVKVGDNHKTFSSKKLNEAKNYLNQQLLGLLKKTNYSEFSRILRNYKKSGILKQGGIIKPNTKIILSNHIKI